VTAGGHKARHLRPRTPTQPHTKERALGEAKCVRSLQADVLRLSLTSHKPHPSPHSCSLLLLLCAPPPCSKPGTYAPDTKSATCKACPKGFQCPTAAMM